MKTTHKIQKTSPITGEINVMEMTFNIADFRAWECGELIQNAMPYLSADEREFLMTGMTPEDWANTFGEEE